jgi:hypothetical protein
MRVWAVVLVAAFAVGAVSTADAQQVRPRRAVVTDAGPGSTTITSRDEQGRVRTKILVQKRSYLDGGTEVMPGDVQTTGTNMINSLYYSPSRASVSNDNIVPSRPIPDPFFLPGKNNPFFN